MEKFNTDDNNIRFIIESAFAKFEKTNFRLWVTIILLILALLGTNAGWIAYEMSFQEVVVTQEAFTDGSNDIRLQNIGGSYYGGESETDSTDKGEENP